MKSEINKNQKIITAIFLFDMVFMFGVSYFFVGRTNPGFYIEFVVPIIICACVALMIYGHYALKTMEVTPDSIIISSTMLPFVKKKYDLRDLDGYLCAKEIITITKGGRFSSETDISEPHLVWFCQNNVLKLKVYDKYPNFYDLIEETRLPFKGFLYPKDVDEKYKKGEQVTPSEEYIPAKECNEIEQLIKDSIDENMKDFIKNRARKR